MRTLIIDNYDSYTYNLFQLISEVNGDEAVVVRNDAATWEELSRRRFDNVVISPGPGTPARPEDFGICADALATPDLPILGVCLGHQGLAHFNGGAVARTPGAVHGRISPVFHDESPLFAGIPQGFAAVRYHSLIVEVVPEVVRRSAWTADGTVMGLAHRERPHWGVQFHPESICTDHGRRLLENFRDMSRSSRARSRPRPARPPAVRRRPPHPSGAAGGLQVHWRHIDQLIDPETAFVHLYGDRRYAYWLDSSLVSDGLSRFSYIGASGGPLGRVVSYDAARRRVVARDAGSVRTHDESIFSYLERELSSLACAAEELPFDLTGGFVGYLGYEVKADCGSPLRHRSRWPDAQFILSDRLIVFDHVAGHTYAVCVARSEGDADAWLEQTVGELEALAPLPPDAGSNAGPVEFTPSRERSRYLDDIAACKREIAAGESYEICLTNELHSSIEVDPLTLYRELRRRNPAPYAAFLRLGRMSVLSSSPERFLHIDRDRWIEAKPIKGTAPRGATAPGDRRIRDALATSEKTRAENLMIVDLLRNDLGAVSELGSVSVPKLMDVETYRTLHQLVSTIRGRRRDDVSPVECIRAAFPAGSMTGAPKLRTMGIIDRLEGRPRGVYSGAIGFLGLNDAVDLSVVIRTLVVDPDGCSIGTGGAIVAQSVPEEEHDETLLKARALLDAVASVAARPPRSIEAILASGFLPPPGDDWAPRTVSALAWRG
ncbi:MAG: aminodeoxychorismate synthase component I [Solirubrobacteraceae bacterium]